MNRLGILVALTMPFCVGGADPKSTAAPIALFGETIYRNMVNLKDKNPPLEFDVKEKAGVKWIAKLGSRSYGGPTVYGGKIFVGTNNADPRNPRDTILRRDGKRVYVDKGVLMCFDEATGKFIWQHVNDKLPSGQVHDWPDEGVCSGPACEGERVYYVSNRCEVVCLDALGFANGNQGVTDEQYKDPTDADVIWRLDMMKELNVFPHNMAACSPLLVGQHLFIVTANGVDEGHKNIPSPEAPSFICVDKNTGKVVWKSSLPGMNIMHGQWSNPTYLEVKGKPQVIFPGGDGWLYTFEPASGKLLWKFDCNPKASRYELGGKGTRSDFIATPVVHDGLVYVGTGQDPEHFTGVAHLWCIDPSKATTDGQDLSPVDDNFDPKAAVNAKSGMVWHYGGPTTREDRDKLNRDFYFGRTMSTVSVHDGLVYAAELDGFLHVLDAKTGELYWRHDCKGAIWGSTYWVDGKIYLPLEDGDLYVFTHGKEKKEPVKIDVGEPIRSTAIMANGVFYIMTESNLFAIPAQKK